MLKWVRKHLTLIFLLTLALPLGGCPNGESPVAREPSPPLDLVLFDGTEFSLATKLGSPVMINFFASWCIPCGEEASALEKVYQEYSPKGVQFLGVALQDTEEKAKGFVSEKGITFPTGIDMTGKIKDDFGVYGMPTTYFIDREGRVSYLHAGGVTEALLKYELDKLI
ncbi:MAG: TlpA family protein disulfide reductase [Magnetococcales bacterium]|nr:TlpA family protein disulfide reductase [Magnetococcales bacterium]